MPFHPLRSALTSVCTLACEPHSSHPLNCPRAGYSPGSLPPPVPYRLPGGGHRGRLPSPRCPRGGPRSLQSPFRFRPQRRSPPGVSRAALYGPQTLNPSMVRCHCSGLCFSKRGNGPSQVRCVLQSQPALLWLWSGSPPPQFWDPHLKLYFRNGVQNLIKRATSLWFVCLFLQRSWNIFHIFFGFWSNISILTYKKQCR